MAITIIFTTEKYGRTLTIQGGGETLSEALEDLTSQFDEVPEIVLEALSK